MEGQQVEATPVKQETSPEKKSLAKKTATFIKNRVVAYIKNLNPLGKDKFWWTGNLLSAAGTAALFLSGPPGLHKIKSLASAAFSVGLYAGERAMEKHRNKNWSEERRAEWAAKRQEKFPNGTSRIKRFLLGVSAGGVYGAAFGETWLGFTSPEGYHPIKNLEERYKKWKSK